MEVHLKKLVPALAVAVLALVGCSAADSAPEPSAPVESSPVAAESASPSPESVEAPESVAQIKAAAIESGRPAAAWDIDCVAWEMPEAGTEGQAWANEVATGFLESKRAECPDQIAYPHYYIDEFQFGGDGELILIIDQEMNRILHGPDRGEFDNLYQVAYEVMRTVERKFPDLQTVKAQLPNGDRYGIMTRGEERRAGGDGLY